MRIAQVDALRVWDSRGRPTVEVAITTESNVTGRAIAPAGASTGSGEALDLRDGGAILNGYDVQTAVNNVKTIIAPGLIGLDVHNQTEIDKRLKNWTGQNHFPIWVAMPPLRRPWQQSTQRPMFLVCHYGSIYAASRVQS